MADLLTVLHDIDRLRGKVCGTCNYWYAMPHLKAGSCRRGCEPYGWDDSCDDWQAKTAASANQLK